MRTLTPQERSSGFWARLKRDLELELETYRRLLEGAKDHDETNRLRGRIQAIRAILSAAEEVPIEKEILQSF